MQKQRPLKVRRTDKNAQKKRRPLHRQRQKQHGAPLNYGGGFNRALRGQNLQQVGNQHP